MKAVETNWFRFSCFMFFEQRRKGSFFAVIMILLGEEHKKFHTNNKFIGIIIRTTFSTLKGFFLINKVFFFWKISKKCNKILKLLISKKDFLLSFLLLLDLINIWKAVRNKNSFKWIKFKWFEPKKWRRL